MWSRLSHETPCTTPSPPWTHGAGPGLLPGSPSRYGGAKPHQPSALRANGGEPLRDKTQQNGQILGPPPARRLQSPLLLPPPLNPSAAGGTKLSRGRLVPSPGGGSPAGPRAQAPPVPLSRHGRGGAARGRPGLPSGFPLSEAVREGRASPRLLLAPAS